MRDGLLRWDVFSRVRAFRNGIWDNYFGGAISGHFSTTSQFKGLGLDLEGLAGGHVILRIRYLYGTVLLSATLSTLSPSHNLASILVPLHTSTGCKTEGGRAM